MSAQDSHLHRAVDHFVFVLACGFVVLPFGAWLIGSDAGTEDQTAFTIFAPFAAALVVITLMFVVEFVERRLAGSRPGWPAALFGVPVACVAAGLAFAGVDPGHHWWWAGLAAAAWGVGTAAWGWRGWRQRTTASG
jgi:hypothetical protein